MASHLEYRVNKEEKKSSPNPILFSNLRDLKGQDFNAERKLPKPSLELRESFLERKGDIIA